MTATRPVLTNGDLLAEVAAPMLRAAEFARRHPDELAVAALPYLAAVAISVRHRLPFPEHMLLCELGALGGAAALAEYRRWKAAPAARTVTRLRGVKLWIWSRYSWPGLSRSA